jgi:hypothetical protein
MQLYLLQQLSIVISQNNGNTISLLSSIKNRKYDNIITKKLFLRFYDFFII